MILTHDANPGNEEDEGVGRVNGTGGPEALYDGDNIPLKVAAAMGGGAEKGEEATALAASDPKPRSEPESAKQEGAAVLPDVPKLGSGEAPPSTTPGKGKKVGYAMTTPRPKAAWRSPEPSPPTFATPASAARRSHSERKKTITPSAGVDLGKRLYTSGMALLKKKEERRMSAADGLELGLFSPQLVTKGREVKSNSK